MRNKHKAPEMKVLIVVRGVPGSGKSTVAGALKELWESRKFTVVGPVEADKWMVDDKGDYDFDPKMLGMCHSRCKSVVERSMRDNTNVIILSNTSTRKGEYKFYLQAAETFGYQVQEIICQGDFGNEHGVPADKVEIMKERFQY